MQVLDKQKRQNILAVAAQKFATQAFHKVLLSDVAEAAGVGKGTLYIYFKNKDDLYLSVVSSGFTQLMDRIHLKMQDNPQDPIAHLDMVIEEMVQFAFQNPDFFAVMRNTIAKDIFMKKKWTEKRRELNRTIETIIRKGIKQGCFHDPHPELSACYIPGLVRSAFLDGVEKFDRKVITKHIQGFLRAALVPCPAA